MGEFHPDVNAGNAEPHRHPRLPPTTSTTPWWRTQLHPLDEFRSGETVPEIVDVAIIGGGMAGACTAYHLVSEKDGPAPSLAIFEAREACSGATGRNGGHTRLSPFAITEFVGKYGAAAGLHLALFLKELLREMKACAETVTVSAGDETKKRSLAEECELLATRSWDAFQDERQAADVEIAWKEAVKGMRKVAEQEGRPQDMDWLGEVQLLKGPHVENITSIRGAKAALSCPALSLWPYKFVLGLLEHAVELGAMLYTMTPVTGMERVTSPKGETSNFPASYKGLTALHTNRGTTFARRVVFATNGYVSNLLSLYEKTIIPIRGTACHVLRRDASDTGEIAASPEYCQLITTYNIHGSPSSKEYLNPRPDGSIVFGGGHPLYRDNKALWYDSVDDSTLLDHVKERWFEGYMGQHFRGWDQDGKNEMIDYVWTGIMGYTEDSLPHVGIVPGETDHFILAGFNGSGMASIFQVARGIARMIQEGVCYEETGLPNFFKTVPTRIKSAT